MSELISRRTLLARSALVAPLAIPRFDSEGQMSDENSILKLWEEERKARIEAELEVEALRNMLKMPTMQILFIETYNGHNICSHLCHDIFDHGASTRLFINGYRFCCTLGTEDVVDYSGDFQFKGKMKVEEWFLGTDEFRDSIAAQLNEQRNPEIHQLEFFHYGKGLFARSILPARPAPGV